MKSDGEEKAFITKYTLYNKLNVLNSFEKFEKEKSDHFISSEMFLPRFFKHHYYIKNR